MKITVAKLVFLTGGNVAECIYCRLFIGAWMGRLSFPRTLVQVARLGGHAPPRKNIRRDFTSQRVAWRRNTRAGNCEKYQREIWREVAWKFLENFRARVQREHAAFKKKFPLLFVILLYVHLSRLQFFFFFLRDSTTSFFVITVTSLLWYYSKTFRKADGEFLLFRENWRNLVNLEFLFESITW